MIKLFFRVFIFCYFLLNTSMSWLCAATADSAKIQALLEGLVENKVDLLSELDQIRREKAVIHAYMTQLTVLKSKKGNLQQFNEALYVEGTVFQQNVIEALKEALSTFESSFAHQPLFLIKRFNEELEQVKTVLEKESVTIVEKSQLVYDFTQKKMSAFGGVTVNLQHITVGSKIVSANVLSAGLIGHYFESVDEDLVGYWHHTQKKWIVEKGLSAVHIRDAISIAASKRSPDIVLLMLPTQQIKFSLNDSAVQNKTTEVKF